MRKVGVVVTPNVIRRRRPRCAPSPGNGYFSGNVHPGAAASNNRRSTSCITRPKQVSTPDFWWRAEGQQSDDERGEHAWEFFGGPDSDFDMFCFHRPQQRWMAEGCGKRRGERMRHTANSGLGS